MRLQDGRGVVRDWPYSGFSILVVPAALDAAVVLIVDGRAAFEDGGACLCVRRSSQPSMGLSWLVPFGRTALFLVWFDRAFFDVIPSSCTTALNSSSLFPERPGIRARLSFLHNDLSRLYPLLVSLRAHNLLRRGQLAPTAIPNPEGAA